MKKYTIRVLFYTGFNHFYDKIVARISVAAENREQALEKAKALYPKATNEMILNCGTECFIMGKWKEELKYEFV